MSEPEVGKIGNCYLKDTISVMQDAKLPKFCYTNTHSLTTLHCALKSVRR
jgi:hypothetical protein